MKNSRHGSHSAALQEQSSGQAQFEGVLLAVIFAEIFGESEMQASAVCDRMPASARYEESASVYCFSPVSGLRIKVPLLRIFVKSNIWLIEFAIESNDPVPIRCPPSQLSSMKWITEV